jgi:short-subunit dehydrogenase
MFKNIDFIGDKFMIRKNIAIITGASSGLGKEFVKILVKDKSVDEIWAIARKQEKLDLLKKDCGIKVQTFSVDLSNNKEIIDFSYNLECDNPKILYLINNAGFAKFCSYNDLNLKDSINMIDLNVSGTVSMGLISIPYMEKGARILNIASQASFQPLPYQNLYSSTKAFIRNYSRALNIELKDQGISVTTVCPGWMDTNLFDRAIIGAKKATNNFPFMVTPNKVAEKAIDDSKKRKDISIYGWYTKLSHIVAKFLPQKLMMKIWLKQQGL